MSPRLPRLRCSTAFAAPRLRCSTAFAAPRLRCSTAFAVPRLRCSTAFAVPLVPRLHFAPQLRCSTSLRNFVAPLRYARSANSSHNTYNMCSSPTSCLTWLFYIFARDAVQSQAQPGRIAKYSASASCLLYYIS